MADIPTPANGSFDKPTLGLHPLLSGMFWATILYALAYCLWVAGCALLGLFGVAV